jgi:ribosomal protein L40E
MRKRDIKPPKKCLHCGLRSAKLALRCRHCRHPFPLHGKYTTALAIVCIAAAAFTLFVILTSK